MDELPTRLPLATRDGRANLIRAFKAGGCVTCGRRYPEVDWSDLHVDHVDPTQKPRGNPAVGTALRGGTVTAHTGGTERLLAELLLCQVLCVDCHKTKHRNGANGHDVQLALFFGTGRWLPTKEATL